MLKRGADIAGLAALAAERDQREYITSGKVRVIGVTKSDGVIHVEVEQL